MANAAAAPRPGVEHRVVLGDSLLESVPSTSSTYAVLRYDFKPASEDRSRKGTVQVLQDRRQLLHSLPTVNADEPDIDYQGKFDQGNELECVAIFDGKGGFRLERLIGQAYLRHSNTRTFTKRETTPVSGQPQASGGSPDPARAAAANASPDSEEQEMDAELEAELECGLLEDAAEEEQAPESPAEPMQVSTAPSPPPRAVGPIANPPAQHTSRPPSHAAGGSSSGAAAAAVVDRGAAAAAADRGAAAAVVDRSAPAAPAAAAAAAAPPDDTMNDLEREFLGLRGVSEPPAGQQAAAAAQPPSPSSSGSSSSGSSSSSSSSSDSSDDEEIHKCSDDESEGKDVEWI